MTDKKSFMPVELKIVDLTGNHLASILESDRTLVLKIIDNTLEKDIQDFFDFIETASIYLKTGKREERDGKVIHTSKQVEVKPGDPMYLKGLQDWIMKKKIKIGEKRVRGLAVGREG